MVKCGEEINKYMIFKTNQGTDVHLRYMKIKDIYPNTGVIVYGIVVNNPKDIAGGIVVFEIDDGTGKINCVAYEPTKDFRNLIRKLRKGDIVGVYGTVREEPFGINIEKLKISNSKDEIKPIENIHKYIIDSLIEQHVKTGKDSRLSVEIIAQLREATKAYTQLKYPNLLKEGISNNKDEKAIKVVEELLNRLGD